VIRPASCDKKVYGEAAGMSNAKGAEAGGSTPIRAPPGCLRHFALGLAPLDVSRRSCSFLPRARASSTFTWAPLEVEAERHQRESLLLDLAYQAPQLLAAHQELSRTQRIGIEPAGLGVRTDVAVVEEQLPRSNAA